MFNAMYSRDKKMKYNLFGEVDLTKNIMRLRVPYMGSKNKIALPLLKKMLEIKPKAKYFYDLFGGGGSMSFLAAQLGLKVVYNEKQTDLVNFIKYIFDRVKNNEKSKFGIFPEEFYDFVSREEFMKQKKENTIFGQFCRICYSFGSSQRSYAFGLDKEKNKKLAHNIVMFQCEESLKEFNEINSARFAISNKITWNERKLDLQQLERLEQLEQLQRLQLNYIEFFNLDYKDVIINTPPEETIVYCDPPYRNTDKYIEGKDFNYNEFDEWFKNNKHTCFMSEYIAPHKCIFETEKASLMNNKRDKQKKVIEKLYINQ